MGTSPTYRPENQVSRKGRRDSHWSWFEFTRLLRLAGVEPCPHLENAETQILIRKSWSSICSKSCCSTFPSYTSAPEQMKRQLFRPVVQNLDGQQPFYLIRLFWNVFGYFFDLQLNGWDKILELAPYLGYMESPHITLFKFITPFQYYIFNNEKKTVWCREGSGCLRGRNFRFQAVSWPQSCCVLVDKEVFSGFNIFHWQNDCLSGIMPDILRPLWDSWDQCLAEKDMFADCLPYLYTLPSLSLYSVFGCHTLLCDLGKIHLTVLALISLSLQWRTRLDHSSDS